MDTSEAGRKELEVAEKSVAAGVRLAGDQNGIGAAHRAGLPREGEQNAGHGGVGKKNSKSDYSDHRK